MCTKEWLIILIYTNYENEYIANKLNLKNNSGGCR